MTAPRSRSKRDSTRCFELFWHLRKWAPSTVSLRLPSHRRSGTYLRGAHAVRTALEINKETSHDLI